MRPGSDSRLLRLLNGQRIVDAMFDASPAGVSRADIARATGLSKPTVSGLVAELEASGLVRLASVAPAAGGVGRPATLYEIVPEAGFVIAADIGATKIIVGIADLMGTVVSEVKLETGPDATTAIATVCQAASSMLAALGGQAGAVSIGVPGVYRPETDRVERALNLPGFDDIEIRKTFEQQLQIEVYVDNDVNMAALGEANAAQTDNFDATDFVAISVGTGIGMGLIVDGSLYRGGNGAAGEIGSIVIEPAADKTSALTTLEDLASASAMRKLLIRAREQGHQSQLEGDVDVPEILQAAAQGDPAAVVVLDRAAGAMATAVSHLTFILDPQRVVFGGGIGANPVFVSAVADHLRGLPIEPTVELAASTLGRRATFLGAISRALAVSHESLVTHHLGGTR